MRIKEIRTFICNLFDVITMNELAFPKNCLTALIPAKSLQKFPVIKSDGEITVNKTKLSCMLVFLMMNEQVAESSN